MFQIFGISVPDFRPVDVLTTAGHDACMASAPTPPIGRICTTPNCGKPLRARGFCVACYYRSLRHGDVKAGSQTGRWKHRLSAIDPERRAAVCAACGPVNIRQRGKAGKWRCGKDANERSRLYKHSYRASRKAVLADTCEICGSPDQLCWDHDHATGAFRGTLCNACNCGVGFMRDSPDRLRAAAAYLESR